VGFCGGVGNDGEMHSLDRRDQAVTVIILVIRQTPIEQVG
jgi:hypothetical protein